MNIEEFQAYCQRKKGVSEDFPFDETTLCVRVMGKIFAITGLDAEQFKVNLKCDPHWAIQLRAEHTGITPGYHMNKRLWNTVIQDGSVDDRLLERLIEHSRECVLAGCSRSQRDGLLGRSV